MSDLKAGLTQELESLVLEKKATSAQFKHILKGSDEHSILLESMKKVSQRINEIELLLKEEKIEPEATITTNTECSPFALIDIHKKFDAKFTVKILTESDFEAWDSYLEKHTHSPYHSREWLNTIKKSFGHDSVIVTAVSSHGDIIGGIPLSFFSSKLFGKFAVSIPFINYGGPVTDYWNVAEALINEAQKFLNEKQLSHIEIRTLQPGFNYPHQDKKASLVLQLPASMDLLAQQWSAKLRAQCKRAESFDALAKTGKLEILDDFYKVFSRNMRDLGTPVYAKSFFKNILTSNLSSTILVVYIKGIPVSAAFLIGHQNILEIPWASTIESANIYSANMFMYREVLRFAIESKFKYFDFGRSTIDAGTYKFKKQWGAKPYQHYWYYLLNDGEQLPSMNPDNPKYKLAIRAWKMMPVFVANILGPMIVKNIA